MTTKNLQHTKRCTLGGRYAVLILLVTGLLFPFGAFGQGSAGVILGTITDASNALIPGVEITVTNQGTNQVRQVISNESGNYRIEPLQVGVYTVGVELSGFRKEVRTDVKVDIDARVRLDFRLEVGTVAEAVQVIGSAPIVQTDTSQLGVVVEERKIQNLPLNGRNFASLAYITPGAFAPRPGSHLGYRGGFIAVGQEEKTNQYLLDGVNNNAAMTMEMAAYPNVDAIAEFKVQSQNYGAQYGRYAGVQVDAITKSGTNEFHGSAFGFTRLAKLDARNVLDPWPLTTESKSTFQRKQYGGVIGGPIIRDTLFFFAGFQGQSQLQNQRTKPTVPFPEYWSGDLSRLNKVIRDPLTGQPFPNAQIPASRISKTALAFRPLYPLPVLNTLVTNGAQIIPIPQNFGQPNVKINYNFFSKHQIVGAYTLFDSPTNIEWDFSGRPLIPGFSTNGPIKNQNISIQYVWTVSASLVNEFRAGLSRVNRDRRPQVRDKHYAREYGIIGTAGDYTQLAWAVPRVNITGYSSLGPLQPEPLRVDGNVMATDVVSILKGNHALKIGADVFQQYARYSIINAAAGIFQFTGSVTGDAFADFLLGTPNQTQRTIPLGGLGFTSYPRKLSTDWFFQDDWKANRNLTINWGLRSEITFPLYEMFDKNVTFDPELDGGRGGFRIQGKAAQPRYQAALDAYRAYYPGLFISYSNRLYKTDKRLAPRFGFAWTPGGHTDTVVRGGYGIFYTMNSLNAAINGWVGGPFYENDLYTRANSPTWENPFPGRGISGTINGWGVAKDLVNAYYGTWNLGVQREFLKSVVVDVSYIGKKGTNIDGSRDINQPINGVRPYPLFGPISLLSSRGSSIYHGLQLRVERRSSSGLTALVSYAWGKLIADDGRVGPVQNSYNLRAERGLAQEDMRHRLSTSFVYGLPFGRSKRYLSSASGVVDALAGGWEMSGILRVNSGTPWTPTISQNISGSGRPGNDRPNLIANPAVKNAGPLTGWWNPAAFSLPAPGTFGNAGTGTLIGPGYFGTDLSLLKRIRLREKQDLQFRWEVFNIFNHPNFWDPGTVVDSRTFGSLGSAQPSRQMQGGLRFTF